MTSDESRFLVRWSQRKRAARSEADSSAQEAPPVAETPPADTEPPFADPSPPAAAEAAEPAAALPAIDDMTPESDLSAYLREGVPELLKKTALRKMWSLDPAIRDHVGLSENSWDFNQPDTVPGFGPIGAETTAPDFLSDKVRAMMAPQPEPSPLPNAATTPLPRQATASEDSEMPAQDRPAAPADAESEPRLVSATGEAAESRPARSARRHGGALPRN